MQVRYNKYFKRDLKRLPQKLQMQVAKAIKQFLTNPRHPSLGLKKMKEMRNRWELRVTKSYRITLEKIEGGIRLRRVGRHDILKKEK